MLKAPWHQARALTGLVAAIGLVAVAGQAGPLVNPNATRVGMARAQQNVNALTTPITPSAHPEAQGSQEAAAFQAIAPSTHPEAQGLQEAQALHAVFDTPVAVPTVRRTF